jgi:hypothetical protein
MLVQKKSNSRLTHRWAPVLFQGSYVQDSKGNVAPTYSLLGFAPRWLGFGSYLAKRTAKNLLIFNSLWNAFLL